MRISVTLWYAKPVQIFYQVWYRIKTRFISINRYTAYDSVPLNLLQFRFAGELTIAEKKYLGNGRFLFLNQSHDFGEKIDWNFDQYGKLWNYNLQYFDYLLDETIDLTERQCLLRDFSTALLSGKIKPEPYPVSLRIINTIVFLSKHSFSNAEIELALKRQIDYLGNNLEYHILANHLIENIFSLFIAAYTLCDRKLFDRSAKLLEEQLQEQIMPDGAHYECSPMYQSILLAKVLLLTDTVKGNPVWQDRCKLLTNAAARMLGWLQIFSFENHEWAPTNDAAHGIAPTLTVLNKIALALEIDLVEITPVESGYRKWRGDAFELLIDAGKISPSYQPGHAHADMLSFCMQVRNQPVFTDTGTSTYQIGARRQLERSTSAHNTVSIGGLSQSDIWGGFRVAHRAAINIESETPSMLIASHDGYSRSCSVVHQRKFVMPSGNKLVIEDILTGKSITATAHFHLDHSIFATVTASTEITLSNGTHITFTGAKKIQILPYQQAIGFNDLVESHKIEVTFTRRLHSQITVY